MSSIALVTPWDPRDERSWSGVIAPLVRAVESRFDCDVISTGDVSDSVVDRALCRVLDGRGGKRYLVGHALATSIRRGAALRRRLKRVKPRVIVAVAASQDIAFLGGHIPVIQVSDTTLKAIMGFYDQFTNLQPISKWQAEVISRRSARRVSHTLAATSWARDALIRDDHLASESVTVAPFGPAIEPPKELAVRVPHEEIRLLAVVSDWRRKGGDRTVAVAEELRARGVPVQLTLVGDVPEVPSWLVAPGRVSRAELAHLYEQSDLLLELARSNAAGVTLTDAAAFGLPVLATRSGGVNSIVDDGVTGHLLHQGESLVPDAADAVVNMQPCLAWMREAAVKRSTDVLSWDRWVNTLAIELECLEAQRRQGN